MSKPVSRPKRRGPLRFFLVLLVLFLAGGIFLYDQQNRLQTEEISVWSPRLPKEFDGFRIALLSDFHGKEFGVDNAALRPDLIALTGDLIDDSDQFSMISPLASGLAAIAPTYYVTGNHEWAIREAYTLKSVLRECGVGILSNEFLPLERRGAVLALAGVDDPNGPYDQKTPDRVLADTRASLGEDVFTLLLAHRNDEYPVYTALGVDLTLSGHAHGGIVRLPFTDGLIDTRRNFFPSYTAGLYSLEGGGQLVVSRGLGNVGRTLRILNRPHLPLVILRAGAQAR